MKIKRLASRTKVSRVERRQKELAYATERRHQLKGKAVRKTSPQARTSKLHITPGKGSSTRKFVEPPIVARPAPTRAIRAFEQAIKIFNRHEFARAYEAFESVIERFPDEPEILARARAYLMICQQRLSHSPAPPRTAEALYDRGVIELNRGQVGQAILLFEKALRLEPGADHIVYALASAYAKGGNAERALEMLKQCISKSETYRIHARRDPDFRSLYTHEGFQKLVGLEVVE